jgi:hypothetical protein
MTGLHLVLFGVASSPTSTSPVERIGAIRKFVDWRSHVAAKPNAPVGQVVALLPLATAGGVATTKPAPRTRGQRSSGGSRAVVADTPHAGGAHASKCVPADRTFDAGRTGGEVMSKLKMVLVAILSMFAFGAVAATAAQARSYHVNGSTLTGAAEAFKVKSSGTFILHAKPLGTNTTITCKKVEGTGAIEANTSQIEGPSTSSLEYTACTVTEVSNCVATEPIVVEASDRLIGSTGSLNDEFYAKSGTFTEITLSEVPGKKCSVKGKYKVTGTQACSLTSAETELTEHELSCATTGSALSLGGCRAATFESTPVPIKLNSGDKYSAQPGGLEPLPNETTINGFGETSEGSKRVPVINWATETPITTKGGGGCGGSEVVARVEAENTETHKIEQREATLAESPAGSNKFSGNIPAVRPLHGKAILKIIVGVIVVVEIIIYIDPSGTVVDGNHENAPVWDASVTLLSSATEAGPYTAVENGSAVMSPMNRVNPDTSRANGAFGWEVIEGFYKVEATKTGCGTGATSAFAIPPPVENLVIVLHCEGEQWKLGEEGGEKTQLAVTEPAKKCEGDVRVENVSFGSTPIKVLKEAGIECTIKKKGCEAKSLNNGEKCESELESPGTKPEYEVEAEWRGKKFTKKFAV